MLRGVPYTLTDSEIKNELNKKQIEVIEVNRIYSKIKFLTPLVPVTVLITTKMVRKSVTVNNNENVKKIYEVDSLMYAK